MSTTSETLRRAAEETRVRAEAAKQAGDRAQRSLEWSATWKRLKSIGFHDPTTALLVADWLDSEATNWAGTVCEDQLPPQALALAEHINGRTQ